MFFNLWEREKNIFGKEGNIFKVAWLISGKIKIFILVFDLKFYGFFIILLFFWKLGCFYGFVCVN